MKDALSLRQCMLNTGAVMNYYSLPHLSVMATLPDRTFWYLEESSFIERLMRIPEFHFWPFNRNHGTSAMRGWREAVPMYSMQIIQHDGNFIETDIDICNPDFGVLPAAGHMIEVTWPGKTDQFRVMRGLRKRGIDVADARKWTGERSSLSS